MTSKMTYSLIKTFHYSRYQRISIRDVNLFYGITDLMENARYHVPDLIGVVCFYRRTVRGGNVHIKSSTSGFKFVKLNRSPVLQGDYAR